MCLRWVADFLADTQLWRLLALRETWICCISEVGPIPGVSVLDDWMDMFNYSFHACLDLVRVLVVLYLGLSTSYVDVARARQGLQYEN